MPQDPDSIELPSPPNPPDVAEVPNTEDNSYIGVDVARSPSFRQRFVLGQWVNADLEAVERRVLGQVHDELILQYSGADVNLAEQLRYVYNANPAAVALNVNTVVGDAWASVASDSLPVHDPLAAVPIPYVVAEDEDDEDDEDEEEPEPECDVCEQVDCRCYFCEGCDCNRDPHGISQCENCSNCNDCCDCCYCEGCSSNYYSGNGCGTCDNCDDCCRCESCSLCQERHDVDYHCSVCDRGNGDSCGCCAGYDDDGEHYPWEPTYSQRQNAPSTGTACLGTCGKNLVAYEYCTQCMKCKTCCCAEDSQCHAASRGNKVIIFKDREMRWHDNTAKTAFLKSRIAITKDGSRIEPANRHISVELEIDGAKDRSKGRKLHDTLEKWGDSVVEDGSIHNGWEINVTPSSGDTFKTHIREICDGFEDIGFKLSPACGMHVHVNTKDMGFQDLRRLVKLYTKVERAIYDACNPSRLHNSYSVPCGRWFTEQMTSRNPKDFKGDIHAMLYKFKNKKTKATRSTIDDGTLQNCYEYVQRGNRWTPGYFSDRATDLPVRMFYEMRSGVLPREAQFELVRKQFAIPNKDDFDKLVDQKSHKRNNLRYKALNLHSFFYRGSVEFRHHEGTTDYNVITGFGRVCAEIVSKAVALSDAQLDALPKNPRKAMLEILPADLKEFIIGEWVKHDGIINSNRDQKRARESMWQLGDYAPIV